MRVAADELVADAVDRVRDGEVACFLADLRQEDRLVQVVSELFAQLLRPAVLDRLEHLVGLLEHERTQRGERLLAVPWTAVRGAQRAHDLDEAVEPGAGGLSHVGHATIRFSSDMAQEEQGTSNEANDASGISFPAFVLSLAHTAAVHFGDIPDPVTGTPGESNLPAAQQMIDILSLLEQKTRGNLTAEERQLLEQILYELRMRYIDAVRGTPSGPSEPRIIIP